MNAFFRSSPEKRQQRAFTAFYTTYAPRLWGLILLANLPASQAEKILVNTLVEAWKRPDRQHALARQGLGWLLSIAYAEGLPAKVISPFIA